MHGVVTERAPRVADLQQHAVGERLARQRGAGGAEGDRHGVLAGQGQQAGNLLLTGHLWGG